MLDLAVGAGGLSFAEAGDGTDELEVELGLAGKGGTEGGGVEEAEQVIDLG